MTLVGQPRWAKRATTGAGLSAPGCAHAVTARWTWRAAAQSLSRRPDPAEPWQRARAWFVASYPLLGALAAGFNLIEDAELCQRWEISVAAVDAEAREIYVNPLAGLTTRSAGS